jgi:hypothetical protein
VFDLRAAHELGAGDQHIVGGMKADKRNHGVASQQSGISQ